MLNSINNEMLNQDIKKTDNPLQYLPVGLFGSTVAIAGLAIAFKQSSGLFGLSPLFGTTTAIVGWIVFLLLCGCYAFKYIRFPEIVKAELKHPVQANFLGTFFISAVLLAELAVPVSLTLARIMWGAGTAGGLIFMYILTSRLFRGDLNVLDAVPPTLIPGLTVLNAATAGIAMKFGWFETELNIITCCAFRIN